MHDDWDSRMGIWELERPGLRNAENRHDLLLPVKNLEISKAINFILFIFLVRKAAYYLT